MRGTVKAFVEAEGFGLFGMFMCVCVFQVLLGHQGTCLQRC